MIHAVHTTGMQQQKQQQHFYVAYFHIEQNNKNRTERTKQQAGCWAGIRVGPGKKKQFDISWILSMSMVFMKR